MEKVIDVLPKGRQYVPSISKERTALEASKEMSDRHVGALVVTEDKNVIGIVTERDILTRVVAAEQDPGKITVEEIMTSPVACCKPETMLEECRTVMAAKHIRHLPVVDNGKLVGILASRFLLAREVAQKQDTIEHLSKYIYGP
jgi:CBS domain-containing protein